MSSSSSTLLKGPETLAFFLGGTGNRATVSKLQNPTTDSRLKVPSDLSPQPSDELPFEDTTETKAKEIRKESIEKNLTNGKVSVLE
ncbi:hypothetical protein COLO4_38333 [Corchorus olitorius]|uniref:Uncharacterized protein n=1 Tax=Corchorus olitorius TaxID=93759 RepID=A0A1R3FVU5_9ROSI|nr:hypothetical protein COLO4_38333 [Corchorus olitorius]